MKLALLAVVLVASGALSPVAQANPSIKVCASALSGLFVSYDFEARCLPDQSCTFDWSPYYGRFDVAFDYDHGSSPHPRAMGNVYPIHVHTERQMRALQREFDPAGVLSEVREETLARAVSTGKRQFAWVRLESDSSRRDSHVRSPTFSLPPIQSRLEFDDELLLEIFDLMPSLRLGHGIHGYSLILASPIPNEPLSPYELGLAEHLQDTICEASGICTSNEFIHVIKVSPARAPDGSPSSVFTFSPTRTP